MIRPQSHHLLPIQQLHLQTNHRNNRSSISGYIAEIVMKLPENVILSKIRLKIWIHVLNNHLSIKSVFKCPVIKFAIEMKKKNSLGILIIDVGRL